MHIYYTRNWFFDDYEKMQKNVKINMRMIFIAIGLIMNFQSKNMKKF